MLLSPWSHHSHGCNTQNTKALNYNFHTTRHHQQQHHENVPFSCGLNFPSLTLPPISLSLLPFHFFGICFDKLSLHFTHKHTQNISCKTFGTNFYRRSLQWTFCVHTWENKKIESFHLLGSLCNEMIVSLSIHEFLIL